MRYITLITGSAGTGKSYLLRKMLEQETRPYIVCAPTGIAATNVGGSTIHRTFKINPDSGFVGRKWPNIEVVYVDEASMMGLKLFECLIAGAPNADIVLIGDMAQLPPVKDKFWFQSAYIGTIFGLKIERLIVQYRQSEDKMFGSILNSIRDGSITSDKLRTLYSSSCHIDDNEHAITLAYRNDTVRAINSEKLLGLKHNVSEFKAKYSGLMKPSDCNAEELLQLKPGAEIIMLNNDEDGLYSNGTRAVVHHIWKNCIEIFLNSETYHVYEHTWKMKLPVEITPLRRSEIEQLILSDSLEEPDLYRHYLKTGIEYVVVGTCLQYPMKLAYALTVHKSQGMTLDAVHVITSGFAGCHGIGYVALSRARSLDTLSLDRKPNTGDFKFNPILKEFL